MSISFQIPSNVSRQTKCGLYDMHAETLGNAEVDPSFVWKAYQRYIELYRENEKRNQSNPIAKIRGYANDSMRQFMENSYPHVYNSNLQKDAPVLTTTGTGWYNQHYGNVVTSHINNEANIAGLLPKRPFQKSGIRVLTTAGSTSGIGQAEDGSPPSTIKPTFATYTVKPKVLATAFNISGLEQALSLYSGDDMLQNTLGWLREYSAIEHTKLINRMLATNVTTVASNNLESIDRICSSYAEVTNCGDVDANDSDIYSQDRDGGATTFDAYVNHNSNTDRDFSFSLMDDVLTNVSPYWTQADKQSAVWITGYDTFAEISQQAADKVRHVTYPQGAFRPSVNGVQAEREGVDVGFTAIAYQGIPIIVSNDVVQDTLSRIYLLNLNYVRLEQLMPTMFFQTGMLSNGDPFGINFLGDEGMYVTMMELVTDSFRVHGKIRDLQ